MEGLGICDTGKRALSSGTILHSCYQIDGVLGEGGFGITYKGSSLERGQKVAIKEYFPSELASREDADSNQNLHIFRGDKEEEFEKGRRRFLKEAEVLREFQYLDGIVPVMDYFECNQTAYIVMEYVEGITLKQYVKDNGCLSFSEVIELLTPVMKSMMRIHKKSVIHRDISPDNLLIGLDNKARLIDFGAANRVNEKDKNMKTVILKTGYAPPEQYLTTGKQGPWTDVYAFAAMMFMALTGVVPTDSVARLQGAALPEVAWESLDIAPWQRDVLLRGLALKVSDRYKNLEEFYEALTVMPDGENEATIIPKNIPKKVEKNIQRLNRGAGVVIGKLVMVLVFIGLGLSGVWFVNGSLSGSERKNSVSRTTEGNDSQDEELHSICTMPAVVNLTEKAATEKIEAEDAQIHIRIERQYDEKATGIVIGQNVEAGTTYNMGAITEVILTISLGPDGSKTTEESVKTDATTEASGINTSTKKKTETTTEEDFRVIEEDEDNDSFQLGD